MYYLQKTSIATFTLLCLTFISRFILKSDYLTSLLRFFNIVIKETFRLFILESSFSVDIVRTTPAFVYE